MKATTYLPLALLLACAATASAQDAAVPTAPVPALPAAAHQPAAIVDSFHSALRRGDTRAAMAFLGDEALIFEGGGVERSKAEYATHHLAADAAFSQAVPSLVTRRSGHSTGDLAWIASEGRTTGTYKGRPVDRVTAETMVLRNSAGGWKVVHIHWSSAAAKAR